MPGLLPGLYAGVLDLSSCSLSSSCLCCEHLLVPFIVHAVCHVPFNSLQHKDGVYSGPQQFVDMRLRPWLPLCCFFHSSAWGGEVFPNI